MNRYLSRIIKSLCLGILALTFAAWMANAATVSISGAYEIVEKTAIGSQMKVTVRLHLTNHDQTAVVFQSALLSDFAYPHTSGARILPVTLRAGTSQDISQEFVIPRSEYDQWQKGLRPRVVLELQSASGRKISQVVRLERVPAGKGK